MLSNFVLVLQVLRLQIPSTPANSTSLLSACKLKGKFQRIYLDGPLNVILVCIIIIMAEKCSLFIIHIHTYMHKHTYVGYQQTPTGGSMEICRAGTTVRPGNIISK